ncbi:MAG: membrane protein insertase YidC, partial [Gammaproteobacteria bacterium]
MDNPRVLLAIALSFLVLLIWQAWMEDYGPKPEPVQEAAETAPEGTAPPAEDLPSAPTDQPLPSAGGEVTVQLPEGERVDVFTDVFHAVIDTRGAELQQIDLLQYPQSREKDSEPFRLLEESPDQLFVAQSGLRAGSEPEPTHHAPYSVSQTRFELGEADDVLEVPLRWTNG